ncbi:three-Cys-motif partner protein TcmP [Spirosoma pollinicola]|uniref:Three-Cys-motif partner protein TcmP n=1 Tax=Spirosoma pollinicola TaxID=2057025 RepID=A0A2K8Z420_9BACT|nr:three-Cys-motif partner protein TcmP [Spirosoma pollinicola]AUD04601.1 hypothetical protein CWM47_23785 [Spirosoma pollinicola]
MKGKWERLVYIDLFSGSGYASIRGIDRIVQTSPLIALNTPNPFTDFFFSEFESPKMESLKARVNDCYPNRDITYYEGDTNENVLKICEDLEHIHSKYKTLCFCFVDPFSLNLHFDTIKKLSVFNIDFLILLAIHMDYNRNLSLYLSEENEKVSHFLGNTNWREDLKKSPDKQNIVSFLATQYDKKMLNLGYLTPVDKQQIKTGLTNIPLYHLAFYSRHKLGNDFFLKVRHHGESMQLNLF